MTRPGRLASSRRTAATLVAAALSLSACSGEGEQEAPHIEVKTVRAVQQDVPIVREWVGQTYGAVDIELRARVDGWLQGIHFREGSVVEQGALLYTIDQSELRQQLAAAEGRLAEVKTLTARAKSDVDRYEPLAAAGAVSQRDLEIAVAEYDARKSEVDAAQAAVDLARIELGYATLRAPITGLIGISTARVGDYVGRPPNTVILNTISRIDSVHVRFSITEQEYLELMGRIRAGTQEKSPLDMVLADGSVYPHQGDVLFAEQRVDAATGALQFEASFPNPERLLRPGQFARIRAEVDRRKGAIVVPSKAIVEIQGQPVLYVVGADGKVQFRRIKTGPTFGQLRVVEEGVTAGDAVVVEGVQRMR
ncbi:MAG: efflux RND transporter periplasmic adaptor subunit, partial [bacterium]